jgi:membrane protease YdiL (CAAX protease family)
MSEFSSDMPPVVASEPPPVLRPKSQVWPFFLLFCVFAGLIALSLASLSKPGRKEESVEQLEVSLKFGLAQEAASSSSFLPGAEEGARAATKTALKKVAEEARAFPESEHAARIRVAIDYDLGQKLSPDALKLLRGSKERLDRDFVRIYDSERLTPGEAARLAKDDNAFSSQLARAHALTKAGDRGARARLLSQRSFSLMIWGTGLAFVALALGAVVLVTFLVLGRQVDWPFPPLRIPTIGEGDRFAVRASVAMLLYIFVGISAAIMQASGLPPLIANAVNVVGWIGCTIAFLYVPLWDIRDSWKKVMGVADQVGFRALFGFSGFLANLPILMVFVAISSLVAPYLPEATHPITTELASGKPEVIAMSFFLAAIMAPIAEETIFRGLIMRALMGLFGRPWPAIILQGFLFASLHPQGPAGWLPLMAVGCMCGWLTWRSGSLIPAMVLHFVHNTAILVISTMIL